MGLLEILKGEQPGIITSLLHYRNVGQYGEYLTEYALTHDNIAGDLVVLKNVYVPMSGKTTEIDMLMIHEKGIFVIESKNYSGWIFGDYNQLNWTQSFSNGEKHKFYNPIKQNRTHIKALAEYLEKPVSEFMSYIVFSERCTLKKVPPDTSDVIIVRRPHMLKRLRSQIDTMPVKYSHDEIVAMKDKLTNLTNKSTAEKKQHIENIKTKCPFCGSDLVKRNGKYGAFWGCSAYPKCKFTRPIDK